MTDARHTGRPSVDTRTRAVGAAGPVDPGAFWAGAWRDALERNGERAAADADRLGLAPLAIAVDDDVWTLRRGARRRRGRPRTRGDRVEIALDRDAFADLVVERRTALGLVIGARADGDPAANEAFCAWDPVLRSVLDGRGVYRPGDVTLRAPDGSPLDLDQRFRLGERPDDGRALPRRGRVPAAVGASSPTTRSTPSTPISPGPSPTRAPDDGESWWAATRAGERYPCRILNFERKSDVAAGDVRRRRASSRSARSSATATGPATRSASTSPPSPRRGW